jgi:CheY-like chemotaxis protein
MSRERASYLEVDPCPPRRADAPRCVVVGIDDERIGRAALAAVLAAEHCLATVVGTAAELERTIAEARPGLILLDLMMPGIDGLTLCRQVRTQPAGAAALVVIVTAADTDGSLEREALAAGADAVLGKPLDRHELRRWIGQALARETRP